MPAFSFLCALARGPGSKRLPQVYAMSLGRPIHVHIPAKAKTLTLAISPGGDLPTRNSAITLGTLEEGLLSSAHMSPVSSAYSAVGNLSWDTPTFIQGSENKACPLYFILPRCSLEDFWASPCISPTLRGESGFSGTLQGVGSSQWTVPSFSLPYECSSDEGSIGSPVQGLALDS